MANALDMIEAGKREATYAALEAASGGEISDKMFEAILNDNAGVCLKKLDAFLAALGLRVAKANAIILPPDDYLALVRGGKRLFRILEILHQKGIVLKDFE